MKKELFFYKTSRGKSPFQKWLDGLRNKVAKVHILRCLDRLAIGHFSDRKHLDHGVYELRVHQGPGFRLYYGESNDGMVVMLMGGIKRTQTRDIAKAQSYWADFKERYNEQT